MDQQEEINMQGGSLFTDVADLAIPFGLLLSVKGVAYLANKKKEMMSNKKKHASASASASASHKGGGDPGACFLCMQQGGMAKTMLRNEIMQITSDLKALLSDY
jgi:hypothetical protein